MKQWSISIGFYPGVLLGIRTNSEDHRSVTVFYLPFIDFAFEIEKDLEEK